MNRQIAFLSVWIGLVVGCAAYHSDPIGDSKSGSPSKDTIPLGASFVSIDQNIFQQTCITCHAPGKAAARVPLDRNSLSNSPLELVIPGDPDESGLVIAVERKDSKRMPPSKDGYVSLKADEKQAIRDWIQNGAKD